MIVIQRTTYNMWGRFLIWTIVYPSKECTIWPRAFNGSMEKIQWKQGKIEIVSVLSLWKIAKKNYPDYTTFCSFFNADSWPLICFLFVTTHLEWMSSTSQFKFSISLRSGNEVLGKVIFQKRLSFCLGGSLYDVTCCLAAWSYVPSRGSLSLVLCSFCWGGEGLPTGGLPTGGLPRGWNQKAFLLILLLCSVSYPEIRGGQNYNCSRACGCATGRDHASQNNWTFLIWRSMSK